MSKCGVILLLVCLTTALGYSQSGSTQLTELDKALGDLDGDGTEEQAIVYETDTRTDAGLKRELHIFKKNGDDWVLWQRIEGGVLSSEAGGSLGDPYQGIEIKQGQLVIYHLGGGNHRWSYTHQYRFKGGVWELANAKAVYFQNCSYFNTIDFDLITGTLAYKEEKEDCKTNAATQVTLDRKELVLLENLPRMQGFTPGAYRIKLPGTDIEIFF